MRASDPPQNSARDPGSPALRPSAAQSRVMLTSIELFDRVAEIECATTLKGRRKVPTEFDGVAVCLANWAAIYGPFASLRILQVGAARAADAGVDAARATSSCE